MPNTAISTIDELKERIAEILYGIAESCRSCAYPDCQGYPWIMPEEEGGLLNAGLRLIQFNGESGPIYLDTFNRNADGSLRIGDVGALCPYRSAGGACTVHANRPLTCHLYPLSLEIADGVVVWAVHRDCEFVQRETDAGRFEQLLDRCRALVDRLSPELRAAMATTISRAAAISRPLHMDCYTVLGPVHR